MKTSLLLAVVVHFLLAGWHGYSHQMVPVPASGGQTTFVVIVIIGLPLVGAGLTYTRLQTQGAMLVCLSMIASFLFGLVYHFIHVSVDNVAAVPPGPWRGAFVSSAILVALSEALGAVAGGMAWFRWKRLAAQPPHREA